MPLRSYIKGSERKPVFIDFDIYECLLMLKDMLMQSDEIVIEEMYPDSLWFNEKRGGFCSELRVGLYRTGGES